MITPHQAKYFALELSKRSPSNSLEKFTASLFDAQVDLNPHQVEAALFAFRSPLSRWAILADEVWLWKTIEAWILLSQKWAERKRKILIITPANLRKQWSQEMKDKFFLPSFILESKSFNETTKKGNFQPFVQDSIIIASFQFVRAKESYVKSVDWDLVVIDEAHRLRNVYKPGNKIAKAIKEMLAWRPKVLLTATPLQNSLLELFGLVGFIDDNVFGDQKSFKSQFARAESAPDASAFGDLKDRLKSICKRTLRRQVTLYVNYTNRIALVEEFHQSKEEQQLYNMLSSYLARDKLFALPASQKILMELMMRRLLASSTYAISQTFSALIQKLNALIKIINDEEDQREKERENIDIDTVLIEELSQNFEEYDEFAEEYEEDDDDSENPEKKKSKFDVADIPAILEEITFLTECETLAKSISRNSKWEKLAIALSKGFEELEKVRDRSIDKKFPLKKALIFTESTRTQLYVKGVLEANGYAGKIVLFNGSNNDPESRAIYQAWLEKNAWTDKISGSKTADIRAALTEYFRDEAVIMIATEAAAEGINLQFCSFVINYDLPWNPQRIEQRIWRCHRYGQKSDVVVLNFLNLSNAADQRVYKILAEKFKLFEWVFWVSDDVLGNIDNGVDLERRIARIYSWCRTDNEISSAFDTLQSDLDFEITETINTARTTLLSNFDEEVSQKLKFRKSEAEASLDKYQNWLWSVTQHALETQAVFSDDYSFTLKENPFSSEKIYLGPYRIGKNIEDAHIYRIGHPLAENVINECLEYDTPSREIIFDYTNSWKNITLVRNLVGTSWWIKLTKLSIEAFESEDINIFTTVDDKGNLIDHDLTQMIFSVWWTEKRESWVMSDSIVDLMKKSYEDDKEKLLQITDRRNAEYFQEETEKLEKWSDDQTKSLEIALKDTKSKIKEHTREAKKSENPVEQLELQQKIQLLTREQQKLRREIFELEDKILAQRDLMINILKAKKTERVTEEPIFTVRFTIV